jgi:hypothetical protein
MQGYSLGNRRGPITCRLAQTLICRSIVLPYLELGLVTCTIREERLLCLEHIVNIEVGVITPNCLSKTLGSAAGFGA